MGRARFLLRPRWLVSHLLVAALVVLLVNLGFWQLSRLDERRDRNALVEARTEQAAVSVGELVRPGDGGGAVDEARFRRVTAEGTYDAAGTVVVRNRSQDGRPGAWLVTPMTLADGERVGVIRGFVGFGDGGDIPEVAPPEGDVRVAGLAMDPGRLGGTAEGDLAELLGSEDVLPALVQAYSSVPADAGPASAGAGDAQPSAAADEAGLVVIPAPELGEGPHLGYAVQWFIFGVIALGGYPLILRRVVARRGKEADAAGDEAAEHDSEHAEEGEDAADAEADADATVDAETTADADTKATAGTGGDDLDDELRELLREGG